MPSWTLVDTHPIQGRTFQRPLDPTEHSFFWDGFFNGIADSVQQFELRLLNGARDSHLFSVANIVKAWLSTKRRYPLVGATVGGANTPIPPKLARDAVAEDGGRDGEDIGHDKNDTGSPPVPYFIVREHDLSVLRPREIVFGWVANTEEASRRAAGILNAPRQLSEELLVQLHILREADSQTGGDKTDVLHLIAVTAHCVTDGTANNTFARCLLDTLARGGESEPAQVPLEERLAMTLPAADLEPVHLRSLSPAIRRWRRAVGIVIFQLRMEKRRGGHTLPCRLTSSTPFVPARSAQLSTTLTKTQSATVVANCRLHNVTFGNAYLALAQVAMTRVLYRRYLRGEISEEEWAYRKRQPHISGGPLNLRPRSDKAWFERGGGGEFMVSISFFFYQLPCMMLGTTTARDSCTRGREWQEDQGRTLWPDGAPPFSDLLTFDRFLHRTGLVEKQVTASFKHPLFFEIARATSLSRIEGARLGALQWMKGTDAAHGESMRASSSDEGNRVVGTMDMPMVCAYIGSSFGNVDLVVPSEYPLQSTHQLSPYSSTSHPGKAGYVTPPFPPAPETNASPKIAAKGVGTYLHARPAELYLFATGLRGQLGMHVFYDSNVYEEGVVSEWLDEVKGAVLWYLGQTHSESRRTGSRKSHVYTHGRGRTGPGGDVEAKL